MLVIALIAVRILIQVYFTAGLVDRYSERNADVAKRDAASDLALRSIA